MQAHTVRGVQKAGENSLPAISRLPPVEDPNGNFKSIARMEQLLSIYSEYPPGHRSAVKTSPIEKSRREKILALHRALLNQRQRESRRAHGSSYSIPPGSKGESDRNIQASALAPALAPAHEPASQPETVAPKRDKLPILKVIKSARYETHDQPKVSMNEGPLADSPHKTEKTHWAIVRNRYAELERTRLKRSVLTRKRRPRVDISLDSKAKLIQEVTANFDMSFAKLNKRLDALRNKHPPMRHVRFDLPDDDSPE